MRIPLSLLVAGYFFEKLARFDFLSIGQTLMTSLALGTLHRRHACFRIWPLKNVGNGAWQRRLQSK